MQLISLFQKVANLYMHVHYMSDSYSQFGVDADVGSLKVGVT